MDTNGFDLMTLPEPETESEDEEENPQKMKKKKFKHSMSFFQEVTVMRDLHPHRDDRGFLNTSDKKWRQQCMTALNFNSQKVGTSFGALFREQLYASTVPESCFEIITDLDKKFQEGHIRSKFNITKMTSGVFQSFVGFQHELKLREALLDLSEGDLTLAEFRDLGRKLKQEKKDEESNIVEEVCRLRRTIRSLREENSRLMVENNELKEKLERLTEQEQPDEVAVSDGSVEETPLTSNNEPTSNTTYAIGSIVEAYWQPGNTWYEAKILQKTSTGFRVKYTIDNVKQVVPEKHIRLVN